MRRNAILSHPSTVEEHYRLLILSIFTNLAVAIKNGNPAAQGICPSNIWQYHAIIVNVIVLTRDTE